MKYFLDTEFIEGFKKPISWLPTIWNFNKPYHSIQLISIGIVAEGGREYYAISSEFDLKEAWNRFDWKQRTKEQIAITPALGGVYKEYWLRDNVLKLIFEELKARSMKDSEFVSSNYVAAGSEFSYRHLKTLIKWYGKSNKQIAEEIKDFVSYKTRLYDTISHLPYSQGAPYKEYDDRIELAIKHFGEPEFYGYYADYDWVLFCSLFGRMIDLPKGFPMYCRDLKQMFDEKMAKYLRMFKVESERDLGITTVPEMCEHYKTHPDYPKQENKHNALTDAKWNQWFYNFLNNLQIYALIIYTYLG